MSDDTVKFNMRTVLDFFCPFCKGKCSIVTGGPIGDLNQGVAHAVPACEKFNTLEPTEFLRACNRHRQEH